MTPEQRLQELREGRSNRLVAHLPSGFVVLGEFQYLRGYCLLLAEPWVGQLNDLVDPARQLFLSDMARLGDAIRSVTGCKRLNYSIYGNLDPFLHAHVWPRYENEASEFATAPPLSIPATIREATEHRFDSDRDGALVLAIREALKQDGYPL